MPYIVPSKLKTPVGVVLSPSCLLPLKPLPPMCADIADSTGCHTPPVFAYARRLAVVDDADPACTITTCVVPAGSVLSRDASFAVAVVPAAAAFLDTDGDGDTLRDGADDGDADGSAEGDTGDTSVETAAETVGEETGCADADGFPPQAVSTARSAAITGNTCGARRLRWSTGTPHSIGPMVIRIRPRRIAASALVLLVLTGCGGGTGGTAASGSPPSPTVAAGRPDVLAPSQSSTGTPPAAFEGTVSALPAGARQRMTGVSWRSGCPVGLDDLRLLRVSFIDFDGVAKVGELVVHKAIADAVVRVFGRLYAVRFPIRGMQTIEAYDGSDDASMAADNTSAFNCRNVPNTTHWSNHAYGRAIDINTVENPYLPGKQIMPPAGRDYLDRRNIRPGMIAAGDAVVTAFKAEGFTWGGGWRTGVDYQHFEKPG